MNKRKTRDNHLDYGIMEFNRLVMGMNNDHNVSIENIRLSAIQQMDKDATASLAEYFKKQMPHWGFLNGNDYKTNKYVIQRLSRGVEDEFKRSPWGDKYLRVRINIDPDKMAVVRKIRYKNCRIHKDKESVGKGLCGMCYARIRRLDGLNLLRFDTPTWVLNKILSIPKLGRGSRQFIKKAKEIILQW